MKSGLAVVASIASLAIVWGPVAAAPSPLPMPSACALDNAMDPSDAIGRELTDEPSLRFVDRVGNVSPDKLHLIDTTPGDAALSARVRAAAQPQNDPAVVRKITPAYPILAIAKREDGEATYTVPFETPTHSDDDSLVQEAAVAAASSEYVARHLHCRGVAESFLFVSEFSLGR